MGRGIAGKHNLALHLDGIIQSAQVLHRLLAQTLVNKYVEIIKTGKLRLYTYRKGIAPLGLVKGTTDEHRLLLGERDTVEQMIEERRITVELIERAALDDIETAVAEELKVIIKVAAGYA